MKKQLQALIRLCEGNRRFVANCPINSVMKCNDRSSDLLSAQAPFAIILGCSDSRVPVEMIFDQGFGDLFVIRVAGNIVAPSQIGSVEFAAERFGTRLVVVLGHSNCGAIMATLEELKRPHTSQSPNLRSIVDRVRPSVEPLLTNGNLIGAELVQEAVRANIRASTHQLRHGSAIIERLVAEDGLRVVGAEYSLHTGEVNFFDGAPEGLAELANSHARGEHSDGWQKKVSNG